MGCTADFFNVFVPTVGEGEALEKIMTVLHSPDVDCLLVMTLSRYRLQLLLLHRRGRLSFAGTDSLHRGDGGGGGGGGGDGGCWLRLNTATVSTDSPGSTLRSLQSRAV